VGTNQQVAKAPLRQCHQSRLAFFAVLGNFPHDANLALFEIDIFELEVPDFSTAASRAYGDGSAVHCQLPILVCQSRGNQGLDLILACHLACALFHLAKWLIPDGEVFIPAARIGHHAPQQEHLAIHGPACYRFAHGTADVLCSLLLIFPYMGERDCIHSEIRSKESLNGLEDPLLALYPSPPSCSPPSK
jgi:hypothetical protein